MPRMGHDPWDDREAQASRGETDRPPRLPETASLNPPSLNLNQELRLRLGAPLFWLGASSLMSIGQLGKMGREQKLARWRNRHAGTGCPPNRCPACA